MLEAITGAITGAIIGLIAGIIAAVKLLVKRISKEELEEIIVRANEVYSEYEKAKQKESEGGEEITRDELLVIAEKGAGLAEAILKAIRE